MDTNQASRADGLTPLCAALREGNFPLASRLIDMGADINAVNKFTGETALTTELKKSPPNYQAVQLLLERKSTPKTSSADLTLKNGAGQTPVQLALASVSAACS